MTMIDESNVRLISPNDIRSNPENPRLVFREKELLDLEKSISSNGILVPLTVYREASGNYVLLDGERRWLCARKLALLRVPIIVQPEPSRLQNIMMMFAIHNARTDWDPLPTALKLRKLEGLFNEAEGRVPTEIQLAQLASLSRGEVRRLKNILALPQTYLDLIEAEQDLPRSQQNLTVDHLLEVVRGTAAVIRATILEEDERVGLEGVLIGKFQKKILSSTVEPRLLTRMARSVERGDVSREQMRQYIYRLIEDPTFTVREAYDESTQEVDIVHNIELTTRRLIGNVLDMESLKDLSDSSRLALRKLRDAIDQLLGR